MATRSPNKPGRPTKTELKAVAKKRRDRFAAARKAETDYKRHLRKIAHAVGGIVSAYAKRGWVHDKLAELVETLQKYGTIIEPWARAVAARMLADVSRRDEKAWREASAELGREIETEIASAPTGSITRELLAEQVRLIKSLPIEAAERVQRLALKQVETGGRAETLAREIMRTGHVTQSRADLIARTETSRAATAFTQARAVSLGSEGYVWRTAKDESVRESHRKMEGKFVRWGAPPTLDKMKGHAGALPNCRCIPEVVFKD